MDKTRGSLGNGCNIKKKQTEAITRSWCWESKRQRRESPILQ